MMKFTIVFIGFIILLRTETSLNVTSVSQKRLPSTVSCVLLLCLVTFSAKKMLNSDEYLLLMSYKVLNGKIELYEKV